MKKFFTLIAVALCAISMNAQGNYILADADAVGTDVTSVNGILFLILRKGHGQMLQNGLIMQIQISQPIHQEMGLVGVLLQVLCQQDVSINSLLLQMVRCWSAYV